MTCFLDPGKRLGISQEPRLLLFFHLLFIFYASSQSFLGPGPISSHQMEAAGLVPDELTLQPVMLIPLTVPLPSSVPQTIPHIHRFSFIFACQHLQAQELAHRKDQPLNDVPWAALCTSSYV